jgi:transglutaminase-like putative cysteine protease
MRPASLLSKRLGTIAAQVLIVVLAIAAQAPAAEPIRLDISVDEAALEREDWFGIYSGEDKLGYMRVTQDADSSRDLVIVENEMHIKVVTLGERREVRSFEKLEFAARPPFRLLRGTGEVAQGPYRQQIELSQRDGQYEASIRAAGAVRTLPVPNLDFTLEDVLTAELWFRSGRQPGDSVSTRAFSLVDLNQAVDTYHVDGIKQTIVDGVPVSYYEVALHSSVAGDVGTALIDTDGRLVSGVLGGAFELRRESAELAPDFDYAADVYLLGLAQIDNPLGDPRTVTSLTLEVEGDDPGAIPPSSHQSIRYDEERSAWILVTGAGTGEPQPASVDEIRDALQESVEHPIHDAEILQLARRAVGDAQEPIEQITALVAFVDTFLADSYSAEPLTVLDMLTTRQGDCTEHALLFTTLARSLDIPTREVTGLLYLGDDVQAFGGHAWNEVVIDGHWTPVDATWGEVTPNATHIRLGTRVGDDASVSSLFSNFSFRLLELGRI